MLKFRTSSLHQATLLAIVYAAYRIDRTDTYQWYQENDHGNSYGLECAIAQIDEDYDWIFNHVLSGNACLCETHMEGENLWACRRVVESCEGGIAFVKELTQFFMGERSLPMFDQYVVVE